MKKYTITYKVRYNPKNGYVWTKRGLKEVICCYCEEIHEVESTSQVCPSCGKHGFNYTKGEN
jgi:rubrerythrin